MRVWRVHPTQGFAALRWVLVWMSVCFLVFAIGPPYRRRLKENGTTHSSISCSPCDCYCSSAEFPVDPLDCGKNDPIMNKEMSKDILTMLSEELNLQKIVTSETLENTKKLVMEARKTFSQYQKEAEKCNMGVETCEEARERAEAELLDERRMTALWESRAREYGWKDKRRTQLRS